MKTPNTLPRRSIDAAPNPLSNSTDNVRFALLELPSLRAGREDIAARRLGTMRSTTLRRNGRHVAVGVMLASLVACGSTPGERAVSGAGIGAGAGAAVGAVTGMGVGTGAAIGAAAGGAAGGLTDEDEIDLGDPAWKK